MKNILLSGLLIALLSGAWLLLLYLIGSITALDDLVTLLVSGKPFRDQALFIGMAVCIPAAGLYIGLRRQKRRCGGQMTFRSASVTGLKILLAGGMMASLLALLFLHDVTKGALSSFAILAGGVSVIGLAVVVILSLAMCSKSVTTKREKLP